ncbi:MULTISPECIES: DsbA family protein [Pseudoalteromonas]|uniref:Thiol:disulfide interchange protein n=1 Tax=Pseudoalteromonas amylolytica TaxID=1859457 RepID=A0A1S1N2I7_9GAMM|nr:MULTISPECIES: DsbA family protein [Pseudoalteromonas]OHU90232.1 hypothetical protein BFC16_04605 [Pseudoalteromonas sp. JW3]OHU92401.1 hypothetical protein BET10_05615 [Pseudoalteromonas amylolytica]
MNKKVSVIFTFLFGLLFGPVVAAEFKEGVDYEQLETVDESLNGKVIEIFSYHCHYCYRAMHSVKAFKKQMPKGMTLQHVPVTFGYSQLDSFATTALLLSELDLMEELHEYTFHIAKMPIKGEKHYNKLENMEGVKAYLLEQGVSESQYQQALKNIEEKQLIKKYNKLASKYQVEGTPTFIINGKYKVSDYKKGSQYDEYFTELLLHVASLK